MYIFSANFILTGTVEQCNLVRKNALPEDKVPCKMQTTKQLRGNLKNKIKTESNKTNSLQDLISKRFYH